MCLCVCILCLISYVVLLLCSHLRRLSKDHHSGHLVASDQIQPSCCSSLPQRLRWSVITSTLTGYIFTQLELVVVINVVWGCHLWTLTSVWPSQVQLSDTVMWTEVGLNQTFTTAPRLHLWSSTLRYVHTSHESWTHQYVDKISFWSFSISLFLLFVGF